MRIPALLILTAVTVVTSAPALAQSYGGNYPICLQHYRWGGSDIECAYSSLAQCKASASGLGAVCLANPYYANAQMPREPARRRYPRAY